MIQENRLQRFTVIGYAFEDQRKVQYILISAIENYSAMWLYARWQGGSIKSKRQ